jgi:hypothetical protein
MTCDLLKDREGTVRKIERTEKRSPCEEGDKGQNYTIPSQEHALEA